MRWRLDERVEPEVWADVLGVTPGQGRFLSTSGAGASQRFALDRARTTGLVVQRHRTTSHTSTSTSSTSSSSSSHRPRSA